MQVIDLLTTLYVLAIIGITALVVAVLIQLLRVLTLKHRLLTRERDERR